MRFIDVSYDAPEMNLACDEFLLDEAESGRGTEILRVWESLVYFVVLGVSQRLSDEVHEEACAQDGVPILRRCTAGGCVLQGPGCLNFALVLDLTKRPETRSIRGSYREIFQLLTRALSKDGLDLVPAGISDLALGNLKVSGNAQRRKKNFFLHHGTLMYDFDLSRIERYLPMPSRQPLYRGGRPHDGFVHNLNTSGARLKRLLAETFQIVDGPSSLSEDEENRVRDLASGKYADPDWLRGRR